MNAEITYLYHSGFAVKTDCHFLIFDYYIDTPHGSGLAKGVIDPQEIADLDVVVFSSNRHPDHFNPKIFDWRKTIKQIRYILSDDIRTPEEAYFVSPGQQYDFGDLNVRVLDSTDIGAAFLIHVDGLCIYHAGDLNLWYWNGEPEEDNAEMERRYKEQIDTLKGETIDVAFVPVDPRLEENYLLGLDYFMKTVGAALVVPMHFGDNFSVLDELQNDSRAQAYVSQVAFFSQRGEKITFHRTEQIEQNN